MAKLPILVVTAGLLLGSLFTGCAVDIQNAQPAKEVAQMAKLPGSVYVGWRVFQDRCASCHGAAAMGGPAAPNLLPLVRTMGPRQFVGMVLQRYDWGLPVAQAKSQGAAQDALIDDVVQRKAAPLTMPAWQGEPVVTASIADLYAYLSARAQGAQDAGRPDR